MPDESAPSATGEHSDQTRSLRVPVPGGQVWTRAHGGGVGTPLIVLHGGPGMPSHYLAPLADLGGGRTVVFYDQLGCGRSDRPADRSLWTIERAVAELDAVRRAHGLTKISLLGHSWGGFLALAYASAHPGAVDALVLASPLVSVSGWMEDAQALVRQLPPATQTAIRRHEEAGTYDHPEYLAAVELYNERHFCALKPWPEELRRTFEEMGHDSYEALWGPSEFTQTGSLAGADLTSALSGVRARTLWLCGTRDEVSVARLHSFAKAAGGVARVLQGGTHCVHLEQTERYLAIVRTFLATSDTTDEAG